jgi:hypothetical protein
MWSDFDGTPSMSQICDTKDNILPPRDSCDTSFANEESDEIQIVGSFFHNIEIDKDGQILLTEGNQAIMSQNSEEMAQNYQEEMSQTHHSEGLVDP